MSSRRRIQSSSYLASTTTTMLGNEDEIVHTPGRSGFLIWSAHEYQITANWLTRGSVCGADDDATAHFHYALRTKWCNRFCSFCLRFILCFFCASPIHNELFAFAIFVEWQTVVAFANNNNQEDHEISVATVLIFISFYVPRLSRNQCAGVSFRWRWFDTCCLLRAWIRCASLNDDNNNNM